MIKLSLTRLAVAVGGLALSLTVGAGVASADPDLGPIVNTTCSYPQVMAALNAQDPAAAAQFNASPMAQSALPSRWRARQGLSRTLDLSNRSPPPATTTERIGHELLAV
jgi:hypothetical protein